MSNFVTTKSIRAILTIVIFNCSFYSFGQIIYVSPDGTGDGSSEDSPLGSLSTAVSELVPGDTLLLLDGTYTEILDLSGKNGTDQDRITIKSESIAGAFLDGEYERQNAIIIRNASYLTIDGIKAGRTLHSTWLVINCQNLNFFRCSGFDAGYEEAQDGISYDGTSDGIRDNCHIFDISGSSNILSEDVWAWGTGRYKFLYYNSQNCTLRRGVFRGLNTELGYGYDRSPHSGFNLYNCTNSLAENCIAFDTKMHPSSNHNAGNPWGLVHGGMVFDDSRSSQGSNEVYGCFDLNNGSERSEIARSNPAVHIMRNWTGKMEDVVIWKNALDYGIVIGENSTFTSPTRALIGSPDRVRQNTVNADNMNYKYIDGEVSDEPLWPFPYEDIIQDLMGMDVTITEYVSTTVEPHLELLVGCTIVPSETEVSMPSTGGTTSITISLPSCSDEELSASADQDWFSAVVDNDEVSITIEENMVADDRAGTLTISTSETEKEIDIIQEGVPGPMSMLTINNGTGGGEYEEDEEISIQANPAPDGEKFEAWIGDIAYVSDVNSSLTIVTMPGMAIELTATYVSCEGACNWVEDFAGMTNGVTIDEGATSWEVDYDGQGLFSVENGRFRASNTKTEAIWMSDVIQISGNTDISVDIQGEGGLDEPDYIKVYYRLDGGNETLIAQRNDNFNNNEVETVGVSDLTGNNIQVVIREFTTGDDEIHYWDNIIVGELGSNLNPDPILSTKKTVSSVIKIYPNPTLEFLTISSKITLSELVITDLQGKEILRKKISGKEQRLSLGGIRHGMYFLMIKTSDGNVLNQKVLLD